jgi:hypothetical protein
MTFAQTITLPEKGRSEQRNEAALIHGVIQLPEGEAPRIAPLKQVSYRDLALLYAPVDAASLMELAAAGPSIATQTAEYRLINNQLAGRYPLLPMRFGMVIDNPVEMHSFLAGNYLHLKAVLERLAGKVEFILRISWDRNTVLRQLHQQWAAPAPSADDLTLERRIEIGRHLHQATEAHKQALRQQLWEFLEPVIVERVEHPGDDDRTLVNTSLLIALSEEARLDRAIGAYAQASPGYLELHYSGPLPPYSFTPLRFEKGNYSAIDEARRTLELPERASERQIKQAYRQLAQLTHPDLHNNGDDSRFKQVKAAYELLRSYCRSCEETGGENIYTFTPEAVHHIFMAQQG